MKVIEKLTPEQEARFGEYVDKWTKIGLDTNPADRPRAEQGAIEAYKVAGLPPPTKFYWFEGVQAAVKALDAYLNPKGTKKSDRRNPLDYACYGQHEAYFLSFYNFFEEAYDPATFTGPQEDVPTWLNIKENCQKLSGLSEIAKSAGWFFPFSKAVVFCERPNFMTRDDQGRLHNTTGPALTFPNGEALYRIHGIEVTKEDVTKPMTLKRINSEQNIEVRRVLIDLMGLETYVTKSKAVVLDEDKRFGKLLRMEQKNDEALVVAMVTNSTAEPDGTFKKYFLRVPPTMTKVQEAIKWTFPLVYAEMEYAPEAES